jgi:ABC-2 type transport system ATP-binding protein
MIVTNDLSKQFNSFWAVDGVSIRVEAGQVLALLGPNGAGKTTTVRMLTSVLRPTRGQASIAGYDVVRDHQKVRASVGVLTEQHGLYNRMPASDYLDFFGQVYGLDPSRRGKRTRELLDLFGLLQVSNQRIGEYSKGMRQKLALARAMLHDPPVLLLDEPTSAMDPESARLVRDSIHQLRSASRAIIICTHNLAEAEELADNIAIIRQGKIIASGHPTSLKRELLGPAEYRVIFGMPLDGHPLFLPADAELIDRDQQSLCYRTSDPEGTNPLVLRYLLAQDLPVIGLQEIPRSLEQVYLTAINASNLTDNGKTSSGKEDGAHAL